MNLNLVDGVKRLVEKAEPYGKVFEQNGCLYITIDNDISKDPDTFIPIYRSFLAVVKEYGLEKYVALSKDPNGISIVALKVALVELHKQRLEAVFNNGINKQDVKESIDFLTNLGWDDGRFHREIGLSSITVYRYRNNKVQRKAKATEEELA
jgi:hypothetical protein